MRAIFLVITFAALQASGQIVLRINDAAPVTIATAEMGKLPRHTAVLNDHGKQISYEGVLLHDVLAQGGVDFGEGIRGKQLSTYVAALASDGYEVVYVLAEVDPTIRDSDIIVADKREGQPLGANEGPLRIVAPQDKRPARSLKMLREIDVVQLKK
jgi:Oxidoreductase molybdopterin binding domain